MYKVKDIRPYKNNLREKYKSIRSRMKPEKKAGLDAEITKRLIETWQYKQVDTILTYVSTPIEVDTLGLIRAALDAGKRVAVPACVKGTRKMDFYYITSVETDLSPGTFGVLEPDTQRCEKLTNLEEGLCVVPGLSFDYKGFRLGYGKGYYDRFLTGFSGITVGICYACCMRPILPHGRYDRAVDLLISEKRRKQCVKNGDNR